MVVCVQVGEHAIDYAHVAQKEKLSELQLRVRQLLDQVPLFLLNILVYCIPYYLGTYSCSVGRLPMTQGGSLRECRGLVVHTSVGSPSPMVSFRWVPPV